MQLNVNGSISTGAMPSLIRYPYRRRSIDSPMKAILSWLALSVSQTF
ncbi:hypothetical protein [Burkholderia gladioli]